MKKLKYYLLIFFIKQMKKNQAFTLVEMMVVIALIAILALILLIIINPLKQQANVNDNRIKKEVSYLGGILSQMYANGKLTTTVSVWTVMNSTTPAGIGDYFANSVFPDSAAYKYKYNNTDGTYKICGQLADSSWHSFEEGRTDDCSGV